MKQLISKFLGGYLNAMAWLHPRLAGRHAFQLFCHPFRTPIRRHQQVFLDSAAGFSFTHGTTKLRGYRWGRGPRNVLFLHGWQSHTYRWKNYISSLSPDEFSVYAFDAPGHGLSEGNYLSVPLYADVIKNLLHSLGAADTVVAHSIGSFSLLYALHTNPRLPVDKLVLMAPPGSAADFFKFYQETLTLRPRAARLALDHFERTFTQPIDYFNTATFIQQVTVPGLIVHDELDDETPYRDALALHRLWPKSHLLTTRGLGHNLKSSAIVGVVSHYIAHGDLAVAGGATLAKDGVSARQWSYAGTTDER